MADGRLAAATMPGATRRACEAEMTLQYCGGNARQADSVFGWGRHTVEVGLAERRPGSRGLGAQAACSGRPRWEDAHPQVAEALQPQAEAQAQHDPTLRTRLASTRLTANGALAGLRAPGESADQRPAPATMAAGLHRRGFRLRKVVNAQPHKKITEPDAICDHSKKKRPTPRPREGANACASMGKRRGTWGSCRAVV